VDWSGKHAGQAKHARHITETILYSRHVIESTLHDRHSMKAVLYQRRVRHAACTTDASDQGRQAGWGKEQARMLWHIKSEQLQKQSYIENLAPLSLYRLRARRGSICASTLSLSHTQLHHVIFRLGSLLFWDPATARSHLDRGVALHMKSALHSHFPIQESSCKRRRPPQSPLRSWKNSRYIVKMLRNYHT